MVTATSPATTTRRAWLPWFVLLSSIWGASFLFIEVGLEVLTPPQVAFARVGLGAVTLLLVVVVGRDRLPRSPALWGHLAVVALFMNVIPFTLIAFAQTRVTSITAGLWNATTPLLTMLVALLVLPEERPTPRRVAGLLLGFGGVLVLLAPWSGVEGSQLVGQLAVLGAALCYGLGFPYSRRFAIGRAEPAVLAAGQVTCGALLLAPVALLTGPLPSSLPLDVVLAMLALGGLGTGVAYILNYRVIRAAGATVAASVTYLVPVWATVLGVVVLGESVAWNQPLGAAVVIAGVVISQGRTGRIGRRRQDPSEASQSGSGGQGPGIGAPRDDARPTRRRYRPGLAPGSEPASAPVTGLARERPGQ